MKAPNQAGREIDPELVEYLVVVVPDEAAAEIVLESAAELERRGLLSVLDAALVSNHAGEVNFAEPIGAASEPRVLLTARDLTLVAEAVEDGRIGVVLLVEDMWAAPLARVARGVGGYIAGGERIPVRRLRPVTFSDATSRMDQ
jgi:hypothetical protein